jgi:Flp pilus assembly pilin Flp
MGALAQRAVQRALARIGRWAGWYLGNEQGQSAIEYLLIVGACALVGVAGFSKYGAALKRDLGANAKHIEGEGLPNIESTLGILGAEYNETPGWCVKPNYCFAAGTPVQTERGDRPIESIAVGERVWARDVTTGAVALREVVNRYRTPGVKVVDLELSSAFTRPEHVAVTPGHLFWTEGAGWTRADALSAQPLWSLEARLSAQIVGQSEQPVTVYNLEVADFHSYFVGRSHVLVHNGDPASSGCPTDPTGSTGSGSTGAPARSTAPAAGTPLECGESGLYADLGGGARPTVERPSNGMERDHVPSGKALAVRTAQLIRERAEAEMAAKCRDLTPDEKEALAEEVTKMVEKASEPASLLKVVKSNTMTVAVPLPLHKAGRTWFYKNQQQVGPNNEKRFDLDSQDLAVAAEADIAEYERLLGINGNAPEYGGNDVDAKCKAKILAALAEIRKKTKDDYDTELGPIAQARLEELGFTAAIDDKCGEATQASN